MSLLEHFRVGALIDGRYMLSRIIGKGGYGVVFRGKQVSTLQEVAVKVLRTDIADNSVEFEADKQRFQREMKLIGELRHPNIVQLIDWGEGPGGELYMVLDLVNGETLSEVLRNEGALQPEEAVHLMRQVLDALACAHDMGVVHRDLKPGNIIVSRTGLRRHATVLDFGIARITDPKKMRDYAHLTMQGKVIGTPKYIAPEQLRLEPLTGAADIYAWGLMLLEMLTGKHPLTGLDMVKTMAAHASWDPFEIPDTVPENLRGIVARAIEKDVDDRYASAAELEADLARLDTSVSTDHAVTSVSPPVNPVQDAPYSPTPGPSSVVGPTAGAPRSPSTKRPGILLWAVVGGVIATLVAGVLLVWALSSGHVPESESASEANASDRAAEADATPDSAPKAPPRVTPAVADDVPDPGLRNALDATRIRMQMASAQSLRKGARTQVSGASSRQLVMVHEQAMHRHYYPQDLAISARGDVLLMASRGYVTRHPMPSTGGDLETEIVASIEGKLSGFAADVDTGIVILVEDGEEGSLIQRLDLDGTVLWSSTIGHERNPSVWIDSNRGFVFLSTPGQPPRLVRLQTGEPMTTDDDAPDFAGTRFGISRDRIHIIAASADEKWGVRNLQTGAELSTPSRGKAEAVAANVDATRVAISDARGLVYVWFPKTDVIDQIVAHEVPSTILAFDPSGRYLITGAEDGIALWDVEGKTLLQRLVPHAGVTAVLWASETLLITAGRDRFLRFWEVR